MVLYIVVALSVLGFVCLGISAVRKSSLNGFLIGSLAAVWLSVLFMIKLRCRIAEYPCGFMSFTGGFTWHLFVGLVIFLGTWALAAVALNHVRSLGWWTWMDFLGRSMAPLLGLGIAVIWEVLPVSVIHPPFVGGPCPDLPVICHDIPLLGFGGLAYWSAPFLAWTAVTLWLDLKQALFAGSLSNFPVQQ